LQTQKGEGKRAPPWREHLCEKKGALLTPTTDKTKIKQSTPRKTTRVPPSARLGWGQREPHPPGGRVAKGNTRGKTVKEETQVLTPETHPMHLGRKSDFCGSGWPKPRVQRKQIHFHTRKKTPIWGPAPLPFNHTSKRGGVWGGGMVCCDKPTHTYPPTPTGVLFSRWGYKR